MPGTRFPLEVVPRIPKELERLNDVANDLVYSWDRAIRSLFHRLDRELWAESKVKSIHRALKIFRYAISVSGASR